MLVGFVWSVLDDNSTFPTWHRSNKFWSWGSLLGCAQFCAVVAFFGWGANVLLWYAPEHVPEDYEGMTRFGGALTIGGFAAGYAYQIAIKLRNYRVELAGKNQILEDINKHSHLLLSGDVQAKETIDKILSSIEENKGYGYFDELSSDRRTAFFKVLKRANASAKRERSNIERAQSAEVEETASVEPEFDRDIESALRETATSISSGSAPYDTDEENERKLALIDQQSEIYHEQVDDLIRRVHDQLLEIFAGRESYGQFGLKTLSVFLVHLSTLMAVQTDFPNLHRSSLNGFRRSLAGRTPNTQPDITPPKGALVSYLSLEESFMASQAELYRSKGHEAAISELAYHLGGGPNELSEVRQLVTDAVEKARSSFLNYLAKG